MKTRTNADIIRIVTKWQEAGFVHELACPADDRHEALAPVEREGVVVLVCPSCGKTQDVPPVVLGSEAVIDYNRRLAERLIGTDEIRQARQDAWFAFVFLCAVGLVFPGLIGGLLYALVGFGLAAAGGAVYLAARFRTLDRLLAERASRP